MTRYGALLVVGLAFWPVWPWIWSRTWDAASQPWGLVPWSLALFTFATRARDPRIWMTSPPLLAGAAGLMLSQAATWGRVPRLASAGLAMLTLALVLLAALPRGLRRRSFGLVPLMVMGLPVEASLHFYLGHPLRRLASETAAGALRMGGMPATLTGVTLRIDHHPVFVDPACSGVTMLWGSLVLAIATVTWRGGGPGLVSAAAAAALSLSIVANAWRSGALVLASAVIPGGVPDALHELAGLLAFSVIAVPLARLSPRSRPCAL